MATPEGLEVADILPQVAPLHPAPASAQLTPWFFVSFCSVAVKFWVRPVCTDAEAGLTPTVMAGGATIVTWAVAVFELSACAMTVIVTVAGFGTLAGAVNVPSVAMVPCTASPPTTPLPCHVTAVFAEFDTVTMNFCVADVCTEILVRFKETATSGAGPGWKREPTPAHPERPARSRSPAAVQPRRGEAIVNRDERIRTQFP